jgi:hypothetical protein
MVKDYLDMFILAIQENEYDEVPNWITKNINFIKLLKKDIIKTIEYTLDTKCDNIAKIIEPESVFNEYKKTYPEEYSKNHARKKFNI